MNIYFGLVITSMLVGMAAAFIAYRTNRDPLRWFLMGVLVNVAAVGLLALLRERNRSRGRVA